MKVKVVVYLEVPDAIDKYDDPLALTTTSIAEAVDKLNNGEYDVEESEGVL